MKLKVWKDKEGNKITAKEFVERFKEGINNISPKQKLQNDFISTSIVFVGYLVGMVALIVFWKRLIVGWFSFGLILIFAGMAYSTFMKLVIIYQQLRALDNLDNNIGSVNLDEIISSLEDEKEVN